MNESERLSSLSDWYGAEQLDFDRQLIRYRYRTIQPHLRGPAGLELGPAEGEMTRFLLQHFTTLTVVEGAEDLLDQIPEAPGLKKVNALFEGFEPSEKFDTILMEHILEHVESPTALLERARNWLGSNGQLIIGVPNGMSIHRLVAVKMGLLGHCCDLNSRDVALGHRRVYTHDSLVRDIQSCGLRIVESGGVFFKPLSNSQIQQHWSQEMIEGFYELGKDFPQHAAEIYAVCQRDD
jgi:2-polyprenyl-3-methyl-5-hydroxy-6-metoxy-1,4-benzoquinol methylase